MVHSYVQNDRVWTPNRSEVALHPPMILAQENASSVFAATSSGFAGDLLRKILAGVLSGVVKIAIVIDITDMAAANLKAFRYLQGFVQQRSGGKGGVLVHHCRCDAHQFHITASLVLTRAAVAAPLFSCGCMLRSGSWKWRLRAALALIVSDLQFYQGGSPRPEDTAHAAEVFDRTLLRNFASPQELVPGIPEHTAFQKVSACCDNLKSLLNGNLWILALINRPSEWIDRLAGRVTVRQSGG